MKKYTDEILIEIYRTSANSRSQKAFDYLYNRYSKPLTEYFFLSLNKDNEKAKDFFHDLFIKIIEKPDLINTSRKFKSWIYSVAANMCKNHYRNEEVKQKHVKSILNTKDLNFELNKDEIQLRQAIKKLKHEQRSIIILRFKIQLSIKEIADIYECPEGTIKSRLFYATKELSTLYNNSLS